MPTHAPSLLAAFAALGSDCSPARADGVVVARATDQRGGTWGPCGVRHAVGWVTFELKSVVEGDSPGPRFVGILSCPPMGRMVGDFRLSLTRKRPPLQPKLSAKPNPPTALPAFFVIRSQPEAPVATRQAKRWIGMQRAAVDAELGNGREIDGHVEYGPDLALSYLDDRVVAVRARVALGMDCEQAAAWIGYVAGKGRRFPLRRRPTCEWPARSTKHRLDQRRGGRLKEGWFDLWVADAAGAPAAPEDRAR